MKLYNANLSPYAARVRLALYAKGLNAEIAPPLGGGLKSSEYLAVNPLGKVPALDDGGFVIPESEIIIEYIEDKHPEPSLRPADIRTRALQRLIGRMADLYIMTQLTKLFGQMNPKARDAKVVEEALAGLESGLRHIDYFLEGPQYAVDGRMTLADCALVPALFFVDKIAPAFGKADIMAVAPRVKAYWTEVQKNPHVAKVLGEMGVAMAERMRGG